MIGYLVKRNRTFIGKFITEVGGFFERVGSRINNDLGYLQVFSRHRQLASHTCFSPDVNDTSIIAPNASLNGDVFVKAYSNIGYGTVMRAELSPIR